VGQYTGQFLAADLVLGVAEELTQDLVALGIIGPRSGIEAEA
jgi:hypothetical protein